MTRIFSAQDKQEDEILDQIQNDVEIAMEDGELDTEEYSISKFSDDSVVITDKGNGEQTKATISEGEINLEEMPKEDEENPEENSESEEVKTECDRKFSDKTQKYIDKLKKFSGEAPYLVTIYDDGTHHIDRVSQKDSGFHVGDRPMQFGARITEMKEFRTREDANDFIKKKGTKHLLSRKMSDKFKKFSKSYSGPSGDQKDFSNSEDDQIPAGLENQLQDIAQMSHGISYYDFLGKSWDDESKKKAYGYCKTLKSQLRDNGRINEESKTYQGLVELLKSLPNK